ARRGVHRRCGRTYRDGNFARIGLVHVPAHLIRPVDGASKFAVTFASTEVVGTEKSDCGVDFLGSCPGATSAPTRLIVRASNHRSTVDFRYPIRRSLSWTKGGPLPSDLWR